MKQFLEEQRRLVDAALEERMPSAGSRPQRLVAAMRHSLFAGGKRIRPILVLVAARAAGAGGEAALDAACAMEMVHTYSLIHDDLPAMDDDDFRRGLPTCHKLYGEATAILAGDALLTLAFDLLSSPHDRVPPRARLEMVRELALAAGIRGMVGGQQVDMESEGGHPDLPTLEYIHTHKTGALIRCSLILGALAAGADDRVRRALGLYGEKLGLAFQVVDDILDVTASTEEMGKDAGSDEKRGKVTYVALFGLEGARDRGRELVAQAREAVAGLPHSGVLEDIADYVLLRRI